MRNNRVIIILNHGTRHKQAQEDFINFIKSIQDGLPQYRVRQASMEMSKPNFPDVVSKLYAEGARHIVVIPFFIFSGIHITQDIPGMIAEQKSNYEDLDIVMGSPLMPDERLRDIILDRIKEVFK